MKKIIFIGAGLFSLITARILTEKGCICQIYEQKDKIGGNCSDSIDKETGILYHEYGPHILHIDNKKILNYINRFESWIPYHHEVKSVYKNIHYPMPVNLETINKFFHIDLNPYDAKKYIESKAIKLPNPKNLEEKLISMIGQELYEAFFKNYTLKQWGKDPVDLPESTIQRIPIRFDYRSSYYKKRYSFLPSKSYTSFFKNLIGNDIEVILNHKFNMNNLDEFAKNRNTIIVYTGAIDELSNYMFGKLEWRSVIFEKTVLDKKIYQGCAVINYPEIQYEFTRICEPKHFYINNYNNNNKTLIIKEYSKKYDPDLKELVPCYPILNDRNIALYQKYINHYRDKYQNVYFKGRLGGYKYSDMENTISDAFEFVVNELKI